MLSFLKKSYTKEEKADVSEKANAVISYTSYTKVEKADVSEKANAVISYTSHTKEEKADVSEKANAVISYTSYIKEEKTAQFGLNLTLSTIILATEIMEIVVDNLN